MLVLSRGRNDKVVFPTLGISVEILRVEGKHVRLGIDAPKSIPVLRAELAEDRRESPTDRAAPSGGLDHATRNRLQRATLGLRVLQRKLDAGRTDDAEPTVLEILRELKAIEAELDGDDASRDAAAPLPRTPRALVVEDDPHERELLAGYLRLSGFAVDDAQDGLQAMVHLAKPGPPDVVLLDMKMPRFDGPKTVAAIRRHPEHRDLKIFAVTGTVPAEADVPVGPHGVNRWFTKPVDPEELVRAMERDLAAELVPA
ncbi:MAG: response regulator [Pirellulales bacterium]|nr:response regulator [Pirellulales bacterium]